MSDTTSLDTTSAPTTLPVVESTVDLKDNWLFINPESYANDQANLMLEQLISARSSSLQLDSNLAALSYGEKEKSKQFFETVLDQPPHFSKDHKRIRNFILDWYSANKSLISKSRQVMDLQILTNTELNELIKGFGFPFPRDIITKSHKIKFLTNLIELYKRKGTAYTLSFVLKLYGLTEVIISEWWMKYDGTRNNSLFLESKPIYPIEFRHNESFVLDKPYERFSWDPYWQQSKEEIISAYNDSSNLINLPSITPYISIQAFTRLADLNLAVAIMQRKVYETLSFWMAYTLIPVKVFDKYDDWAAWVKPPTRDKDGNIIQINTVNPKNEVAFLKMVAPIKIVNSPPSEIPITEDDYDDLIADNNYKNLIVVVGPDPDTNSDFDGHARQLATYTWDSSSNNFKWNFSVVRPTTDGHQHFATGFISHEESEVAPNKIIKWGVNTNGFQTLEVFTVAVNSCVPKVDYPFFTRPSESFVYNGTRWVPLGTLIPEDELLNRGENINRDVILNGFPTSYSSFEVMLAMAYLHQGPYKAVPSELFPYSADIARDIFENFDTLDLNNDLFLSLEEIHKKYSSLDESEYNALNDTSTNLLSKSDLTGKMILDAHYFYNGKYAPLDGLLGIRDDIDDLFSTSNKYQVIIDEYNRIFNDSNAIENITQMSFRHPSHVIPDTNKIYTPPDQFGDTDPRFKIRNRQREFYQKFTKRNSIYATSELVPQINPGAYLEALNPDFKAEIDQKLLGDDADILLEGMMSDFEFYMRDIMEIITIPFTYVQRGGDFLNKKLKPIINFFKPFRVRIMDFITSFEINEPLQDSMVPGDKDIVGTVISQLFVDKPFPLDRNGIREHLSSLQFNLPMHNPRTNRDVGTVVLRANLNGTFLLDFDMDIAYQWLSFSSGDFDPNAGEVIELHNINDKTFTFEWDSTTFDSIKSTISSLYVTLYNQTTFGITMAYANVGEYFERLSEYSVMYDNGLPMDDINVITVTQQFLDPMSAPTDPQYPALSSASIWDITSDMWIKDDSTEVDRLEFDLAMKDDFFVTIKTPDPNTSGQYLYVEDISIDDEEVVADFTEVNLSNTIDSFWSTGLSNSVESNGTCTITYNSSSDDLVFTYYSNLSNVNENWYNYVFSLTARDSSSESHLFIITADHENPFATTYDRSAVIAFLAANTGNHVFLRIIEGLTFSSIIGRAENAINTLLDRFDING